MSIALAADAKRILLVELDFGQRQHIWFNWSAFVYYVDFDAVYDRIDPAFLVGVDPQDVGEVGSVSSDATILRLAASIATVEAEEATFFWDVVTRRVYIHLLDGDEPSLHRIILGVIYGAANHPGTYSGILYHRQLLGAPSLGWSRDPLFWGRVSVGKGTWRIDNTDGSLDLLAEANDVFGNSARAFLGFNNEPRSAFRQLYTGMIGPVRVDEEAVEVDVEDLRNALVAQIPDKIFSVADYPNLKDSNEGKSIPIGYGILRNVPAMCTNEAEPGPPALYSFKLFDMTHHLAINEITTVYVDGAVKATAGTDLAAATFTLAAANYSPGQKVSVDCKGYEDDDGNLIENALDVIVDMLWRWLGIPYSATAYDQPAWAAAQIQAPDIGYCADKPAEILTAIEDIAATVQGLFLVDRFGRYSFRIPNLRAYPVEVIEGWQHLGGASREYAPEEAIGVAIVGYAKDWANNDALYLRDDSRQEEVIDRYKIAPERTFETLLADATDAQAFATRILETGAEVQRRFSVRMKLSGVLRQLGDIVQVTLTRRSGAVFIGPVKAEVIGISYDLMAAERTLSCRIVEDITTEPYVEGEFIGDGFYGDSVYGVTRGA